MSNLQVMKPAPSFRVPALKGREFVTISSDELRGKWVVLAFYPLDFTFVCPTELVGLNDKHGEFADREAVVLTASTDSVHSHLGWVKADERLSNLKYPMLSDMDRSLSRAYGVLLEEPSIALRGTFIIDPNGVLRWAQYNDLDTGRNIDEILRVLDALQTGKLCPCDWKKGQATLG